MCGFYSSTCNQTQDVRQDTYSLSRSGRSVFAEHNRETCLWRGIHCNRKQMTKPKTLRFEPYARLLTMLGDQLIKNERIALVEIIKNSFDADASWVKVTFEGFGEEFQVNANSKIVVEDDGEGMAQDVLENHWVKPATP